MIKKIIHLCFYVSAVLFIKDPVCCEEPSTSNSVQYLDEIFHSFADEMKNKYQLTILDNSPGFCFHGISNLGDDKIDSVSMTFFSFQDTTIENARTLLINVSERFLEKINSNQTIRPFLRNSSLHSNNVRTKINFVKKDPSYYADGNVMQIASKKDIVNFYKLDMQKEILVSFLKETYTEAHQKTIKKY